MKDGFYVIIAVIFFSVGFVVGDMSGVEIKHKDCKLFGKTNFASSVYECKPLGQSK